MRLSREKINHLSHLILKALWEDENVDFIEEKNKVRLEIVRLITEELKLDDEIDKIVREAIKSYSRKIEEGSQEWEVLYNKKYGEELRKRRNYDINKLLG